MNIIRRIRRRIDTENLYLVALILVVVALMTAITIDDNAQHDAQAQSIGKAKP